MTTLTGEKAVRGKLLVDDVAFMASELAALREDIADNGSVMMIKNGNNITSLGTNPALKAYNSTMKTFLLATDKLQSIIPEKELAGMRLLQFLADIDEQTPEEKAAKEEEDRRWLEEDSRKRREIMAGLASKGHKAADPDQEDPAI